MLLNVSFVFVDEKAGRGDEEAQEELRPKRASASAAGYDLVAANEKPIVLSPGKRTLVPTGIAIALPNGFEAQIRPRSGLAFKNGVTVLNAPGTIDADYRGEIKVILVNLGDDEFIIQRGMRIAQMVIAQALAPELIATLSLSETERGASGFGSTGITC